MTKLNYEEANLYLRAAIAGAIYAAEPEVLSDETFLRVVKRALRDVCGVDVPVELSRKFMEGYGAGEPVKAIYTMPNERMDMPGYNRLSDPVMGPMAEALNLVCDNVDRPPERNCTCHVNPPCSDCVDYGGLREMFEAVDTALDDYKTNREPRP